MAPAEASSLPEFLKPFHERACLAEERLTKLEAALKASAGKKVKDDQNAELLSSLIELRGKLEKVREEHAAEREQLKKEAEMRALEKVRGDNASEKEQLQKELERLALENAKLQYRVVHLVHAVREGDDNRETATTELQKELERLTLENAKLQYRVIHLVHAIREGDDKLETATTASAD